MIHKERVRLLNQKSLRRGAYILYWMQASQRVEYNHALEYAILKANELRQPLIVFFGITDRFPEANERHYTFMLEGLQEVKQSLEKRGIQMAVLHKPPELGAVQLAKRASLVVVDRGYLRIQRVWRNQVAQEIDCPLIQVESDVVVPIEEASPKEEYAAATLRPKIHKKLSHFLVPLQGKDPVVESLSLDFESFDIGDLRKTVAKLQIDRSIKKVDSFQGGTREAKKHLGVFLEGKLNRFPELRNDPTLDYLSHMSPYLHFGQISPLFIALKVKETRSSGIEAFLEELIVRRELSMNFVLYNEKYDSFEGLPEWAKKTLKSHQRDKRPYLYPLEEFENAKTHDPYWNAAQREMIVQGKMHGYMRMYWGKKIIEWTKTPEEAFRIALYLNNKYELDGRDPNGFTGVAWCFGKHDRPWGERPIFGNVRYMNDKGLRRKFDADQYVKLMMGIDLDKH
ncbi:MAG: deoxyribodipyrimidine photo-lyase [Thermodesulfobacteriota bacterium]